MSKYQNNLFSLLYCKYLLEVLPNCIKNIKLEKDELSIYIDKKNLLFIIKFLKNHINSQFKVLIDICGVDYLNKKDRFEINYQLLSILYNSRICLKVKTNELEPIESITPLFKSANWYEREVWDMYGIFFSNHNDLRRILTDYGFDGFPFRKDFPQTGFLEVYYNDEKKHIVYDKIELAQEYRFFDFTNPWIKKLKNTKYVK